MHKTSDGKTESTGATEGGPVGVSTLKTLNAQFLVEAKGVEFVKLSELEISSNVLGLFPQWLVHQHTVVPVRFEAGTLYVAMEDPLDLPLLDQINLVTGFDVRPVVALRRDIQGAIRRYFGAEQITRQDRVDAWFDQNENCSDDGSVEALVVSEKDGHIIRLVNSTVRDAIDAEASDIHFEPAGDEMVVRMRTDGILRDCLTVPSTMRQEVTARLKVLAKMDITEKRKAQDGHITLAYHENHYDLRVSVLPTIDSEKTVIRILDKQRLATDLPALGLQSQALAGLQRTLGQPHGMILVTGPTGSGKTTTLYAMLRSIDAVQKNVITVENPVEYRLDRINQIQVNPDTGQSFSTALRTILRQDPDVIMIGEIRDLETAEIAVQAALTGHLVLSTLHTNDAASAITRLRELGIPAYLLSSCVALTIAQRLLRRVCPDCGMVDASNVEWLQELGLDESDPSQFQRGKGCTYCHHSGYRGRQAVFEMLHVDPRIQQAILDNASAQEIKRIAMEQGMGTLRDAATEKLTEGLTTLEEVERVIMAEEL